jgi:DNA-binding IclR family transcriptional regulator
MSPAHDRALAALAEHGPITARDLAAHLGLATSTVVARLVHLKAEGRATYRRTGGTGQLWVAAEAVRADPSLRWPAVLPPALVRMLAAGFSPADPQPQDHAATAGGPR